jgi:LmbE family N-acetylglucosaminyl deacetylase
MIIAAHPDDEILGCGGTVARLTQEGKAEADEVFTLILSNGITSRDNWDKKELEDLKVKSAEANYMVGVPWIAIEDLPDNQFDKVPLLDVIKKIDKHIKFHLPDIIFTHYANDLNIDHRITYQAVITATRPMQNESVKEIYSFEVLSSTEWNYPTTFSPDTFYDITDTLNTKLQALACYDSEMRDSRHPRSMTGVWNNAKMWGLKSGLEYAEAFKTVRCIR